MTTLSRESLVKKIFSDSKNYPYGFSRSGDFSISESKALSASGCLIAALVDGKITPQTPGDHGYLAAAFGQREPENVTERAWVKYQKRINRPKMGSIYGTRKAQITEDDNEDSASEGTDIEIVLDE